MEDLLKITTKQIDAMNTDDKKKYYQEIRKYCSEIDEIGKKAKITKLLKLIYPHLRSFNIEINGEYNIPKDEQVIFLINHSNSHDFFVMLETMDSIKREVTTLAAADSLNVFSQKFFEWNDSIMIDRGDSLNSQNGLYLISKKIIEGKNGIVFGEGTWNLHPIKPMLNIKNGVTKLALYTDTLVVPTIFEYEEIPALFDDEKNLYERCVVTFGKPTKIDPMKGIISETQRLQSIMEENRRESWKKLGIKRDSLNDINQNIYLNHTYLKKFGGFGFTFDSVYEMPYIYFKPNESHENEYHLTKTKKFEPGIILKTDNYKKL